jgi:hypothetical protein
MTDESHLDLKYFIETLKAVLHEIYVVPQERTSRSSKIQDLLKEVRGKPSPPSEQEPAG